MPITPVPGVNVLSDPDCNNASTHWGMKGFVDGCGNLIASELYNPPGVFDGEFMTLAYVHEGPDAALQFVDYTNYPSFDDDNEGPRFANDANFYSQAGQEWTVKFRWKRISGNSRNSIRPIFKHRPCVGPGGGPFAYEYWAGPPSTCPQNGYRGYEWTTVLPARWYDMGTYIDEAEGQSHPVETLFMIQMDGDSSQNFYGPVSGGGPTDNPHDDPTLNALYMEIYFFEAEAFWTGNMVEPTDDPPPRVWTTHLCGVFDREVFADETGKYVGDFAYGECLAGPIGWAGCMGYCDPTHFFFGCFDAFSSDYICRTDPHNICYPRLAVPFVFGVGQILVVEDTSGPEGLEEMPALEINLPGSPGSTMGWGGNAAMPPCAGNGAVIGGDTGWWPLEGEVWVFQCWAKSVPDSNGITEMGITMHFEVAVAGFSSGSPSLDALTLTDEWQFYQTLVTGQFFPIGPYAYPLITFGGDIEKQGPDVCKFFNDSIDIVTWHQRGAAHIKCAHLYPLVQASDEYNLANFHGHGPVV